MAGKLLVDFKYLSPSLEKWGTYLELPMVSNFKGLFSIYLSYSATSQCWGAILKLASDSQQGLFGNTTLRTARNEARSSVHFKLPAQIFHFSICI